MLTNEKIAAIHANAVAHGFWEPGSEPTFGEYCALIHEEISEAFSAWRNGEPDEYVVDGKPEGVWVELADVVIRCADWMGRINFKVNDASMAKFTYEYTNIANMLEDGEFEKDFAGHITNLHGVVSKAAITHMEFDKMCRVFLILLAYIYAMAEARNIGLDAIIDRKCAYNATRPWRHGKRM